MAARRGGAGGRPVKHRPDPVGGVQANDSGRFDAVIHNAGVGYREPRKITTADGLSHVFAINVLAPYLPSRPARTCRAGSGAG